MREGQNVIPTPFFTHKISNGSAILHVSKAETSGSVIYMLYFKLATPPLWAGETDGDKRTKVRGEKELNSKENVVKD